MYRNTCLLRTCEEEPSDTLIEAEHELTQHLTLTAAMCALLLSDSLSVSELIDLALSTISSVISPVKPELCFSNHPLTESIIIYHSLPVPPASFVEGLHNIYRQAMFNGKLFLMEWTHKNSMSFFH